MTTPFIAPLLGLFGSILVAVFTYWSTKQRERDAEWRKEKIVYYKSFVESLSGIVEGNEIPEGHKLYAKATNNLLLFAPQSVIEALNAFRLENSVSNKDRSQEKHDALLAALLLAVRQDIGVHPAGDPATFKPILWAAGINKNAI
jgi:hypothetical protein